VDDELERGDRAGRAEARAGDEDRRPATDRYALRDRDVKRHVKLRPSPGEGGSSGRCCASGQTHGSHTTVPVTATTKRRALAGADVAGAHPGWVRAES